MDRDLWKKNAYNALLRSLTLSDYDDSYDDSSEEHLVAVYGRTQVGKTSTILRMINLRDDNDCISEVSEVLRADRKTGNSSTSTAIIYSMSEDDEKYGFGYSDKEDASPERPEYLDAEEMKTRLKEVRESIENSPSSYMGRLNIMIPKKCFRTDDSSAGIRIIDLPGFGSKEENEQQHVRSIVEYYMRLAPMCVIICLANEVQSLTTIGDPSDDAHGLGRWWEYPDIYSVVLTRAYSADSIKKEIRKFLEDKPDAEAADLAEYVEHYYHGLLTTKDKFGENFKVRVYPIEVGDSLIKLSEAFSDEEYSKIKGAVNETIRQLNEQIKNSRNGDRLLPALKKLTERTSEYETRIENEIEDKRKKSEERKVVYDNLISKNEKKFNDIKENIEKEQSLIGEINEVLSELTENEDYFGKDAVKAVTISKGGMSFLEKVNCFIAAIASSANSADRYSFYTELTNIIEEKGLSKKNHLKHKNQIKAEIPGLIEDRIGDFKKFCENISERDIGSQELRGKLKDAVKSLASNVRDDIYKYDLNNAFHEKSKGFHHFDFDDLRSICDNIVTYANMACNKYILKLKDIFEAEISALKERIAACESEAESAERYKQENIKQQDEIEAELDNIQRGKDAFEEIKVQNKKAFEKRMYYIEREYKKQHNMIVRQINLPRSSEDRVAMLLNLALLEDDFRKFKGGNI